MKKSELRNIIRVKDEKLRMLVTERNDFEAEVKYLKFKAQEFEELLNSSIKLNKEVIDTNNKLSEVLDQLRVITVKMVNNLVNYKSA